MNCVVEPGEMKVLKILSGKDKPDWSTARNELIDAKEPRYKNRIS